MKIQEELKDLVYDSVKLLGDAILDIHGKRIYKEIEEMRVKMKSARGKEASVVQNILEEVYKKLKKDTSEELHLKAKSFALMLELINACEAAYRSYRLQDYQIKNQKAPDSIIYVFTSHPTESRSQKFLKLMDHVQNLLIRALECDFDSVKDELYYLLQIAVRLSLANNRRPEVRDEMEQIFHIVLSPEILEEQVSLNKKKALNINFRTWVGGDKDGHPKVGYKTMIESFNLSRAKLLSFIKKKIKSYEEELEFIPNGKEIHRALTDLKLKLKELHTVSAGDGKKVNAFKVSLQKLKNICIKEQMYSPEVEDIEVLIWHYPAILLPLEIREDSELVHKAIKDDSQPILKMLETLKEVSVGLDSKWYVRGFVLSMCQNSSDILAATKIMKKKLGGYKIPVVPLFENEEGLTKSIKTLKESYLAFPFVEEHKKRWGGRFEVMVGYSDSSKENGVLPARIMIEENLFNLEDFIKSKKLTPVFFHGSGGSTSRGGGTVEEQTAWWPESALKIHKVTIQGEMVQRNFNNPRIMRSQVGKVVNGFEKVKPKFYKLSGGTHLFSSKIQDSYRTLVNDPSFQELTIAATPYEFLNLLKIGSRPTKRTAKGHFSLRAIPWILCWTQTRLNLPVWWGTGTAWKTLSQKEKDAVIGDYKKSPLLQSYIKNLGFTLEKCELGVWNFHLEHSSLSLEEKALWKKRITDELEDSMKFFKDVSGERSFTWFRPWLGESIYFRSSMIHPLNVIQKIALERNDHVLLRETVTGISCGMLTTG